MAGSVEAGMVHLRLVVPTDTAERVLHTLEQSPAVVNVVRLPGSSVKPRGDLFLCDVAREEASVIVEHLRRLGLERDGSISIDAVDSTISAGARRATVAARGAAADAVIWKRSRREPPKVRSSRSASSRSWCSRRSLRLSASSPTRRS